MARKNTARSPRKRKVSEGLERSDELSVPTRTRRREFNREERDYKDILEELISNPALRYVAAGVATAIVTRIANKLSDRYPEISSFIRENLDQLEGRFGEFSRESGSESARH